MDITHSMGRAPGMMTVTVRHEGTQHQMQVELAQFGRFWIARHDNGPWSARCSTVEAAILFDAADRLTEVAAPAQRVQDAPVSVAADTAASRLAELVAS